MRHRLTEQAEKDIRQILRESLQLFGEIQATRYFELLQDGITALKEDAYRPATRDRPEIGAKVRSLHLQLVAKRKGAASHVIYYRQRAAEDGQAELIILRVLGDRMMPGRRVRSILREGTLDDEGGS
ncbi:MAG: type II toxin-antitoxin system RelE/ParE family toxin [Rhizobiaceae bacterium]|nr:type II toxin-antitoxin system RelE/ParE family toxin [Rhizobiaceae bacterium]